MTILSEIFCLFVYLFVCLLVCLFTFYLFVCLLACLLDVTARVVHNVENKTSWLSKNMTNPQNYLFDLCPWAKVKGYGIK